MYSSCWPTLPTVQAHPSGTSPDAMKTCSHTTARPDPVDEQGGCSAGLGHRALDQLVMVDQVIPLDDRMVDLDHGERVGRLPGLIHGQRRVGRVTGKIV